MSQISKKTQNLHKILFCPNNFKCGINVNHTPMGTLCKFQIDQINRKSDVPSFIVKPINIHMHKSILVLSIIYPNFSIPTLILFEKTSVLGHYKTITLKYTFIHKQNYKLTRM